MKKEPAKQPDRLYHASIGVLVIVVLVSGGLLVSKFVQNRQELSAFAHLAEQKAAVDLLMMNKAELPSGMEAASFIENTPESEPEISEDALSESQPPLSVAIDPYDQNKDMIGWIRIEDSAVDYPVMFTGDDFYINHGFDKKGSKRSVHLGIEEKLK
ncbi:hypothetical protein HNQ56_003488 [Anaerotaenia torta]|uniref:hypothetical protein n=1 Tax=Anaerotaenia torta TaxID=433293 RepID=UPI003D2516C0